MTTEDFVNFFNFSVKMKEEVDKRDALIAQLRAELAKRVQSDS